MKRDLTVQEAELYFQDFLVGMPIARAIDVVQILGYRFHHGRTVTRDYDPKRIQVQYNNTGPHPHTVLMVYLG